MGQIIFTFFFLITHNTHEAYTIILYISASKNTNKWHLLFFFFSLSVVCDWLDPSMVALMTIGTCTFQSSLTLVAPSDFPLPRFRLDLGGPCSSFSVDENVFSLSSQHRFLPCALGDLLAHLQTNKILFVFSERCEFYFLSVNV